MSQRDDDRPDWNPYDPLKRDLSAATPAPRSGTAQGGGAGYGPGRNVQSRGSDYGGLADASAPAGVAALEDTMFEQRYRPGGGPPQRHFPRSDDRIRDDIAEALYRSEHVDAGEVSVEVRHGVVTLEGTVPNRGMKHDIEDLADGTRGVKDVDNRVRVASGGRENASRDRLQGSAGRELGGRPGPDLDPPPGGLDTPEHEEWLLDEADQESLPASDTPSSIQPGSIASRKQS